MKFTQIDELVDVLNFSDLIVTYIKHLKGSESLQILNFAQPIRWYV